MVRNSDVREVHCYAPAHCSGPKDAAAGDVHRFGLFGKSRDLERRPFGKEVVLLSL